MSEYTPEPRRPGRPSNAERAARADEVQTRRRRRETLGTDRNLKLYIPESAKDDKFEHRWVNSRDGRVRHLTKEDDWDVVHVTDLNGGDPDPLKTVAEGTVMQRVGNQVTGENMVLLRKPKEFYEEDKKKEQANIDALEETMRRGPMPHSEGLGASDNAYVPGGRNTIGR